MSKREAVEFLSGVYPYVNWRRHPKRQVLAIFRAVIRRRGDDDRRRLRSSGASVYSFHWNGAVYVCVGLVFTGLTGGGR